MNQATSTFKAINIFVVKFSKFIRLMLLICHKFRMYSDSVTIFRDLFRRAFFGKCMGWLDCWGAASGHYLYSCPIFIQQVKEAGKDCGK